MRTQNQAEAVPAGESSTLSDRKARCAFHNRWCEIPSLLSRWVILTRVGCCLKVRCVNRTGAGISEVANPAAQAWFCACLSAHLPRTAGIAVTRFERGYLGRLDGARRGRGGEARCCCCHCCCYSPGPRSSCSRGAFSQEPGGGGLSCVH